MRALDHVDLQIDEGEFVQDDRTVRLRKIHTYEYAGVSGCAHRGVLLSPRTGCISLKDNQLSEIRNREIGFIFQGFNLIANLNALENVELPLIYRGLGRQKRRRLGMP